MKIKKQFIFLVSIIIALPILCSFFIFMENYIHSSERYLINGTDKIKKFSTNDLSRQDTKLLINTLRLLPPDVETIVIDNRENSILFVSMPELVNKNSITREEIWSLIADTSDVYFYQFTSIPLTNKRTSLITRIPRKQHYPGKPKNIINYILLFISVFVVVCVILILIILKTIFKSLIFIENKTKQLAEGKLDAKVTDSDTEFKQNEITHILESLETMRLSILDLQNKKNRFIMGISHDLRTPVSIIKGYSEAIHDEIITSKEEIMNATQLIDSKSTQLENMIETLINYVKLNDYEIRERLINSSITKIITSFAKESAITANVYKRKIITNIKLDEDIIIPLNEQLLYRSFENIFSNALRYTKENDSIEINSFIQNDELFLEIKDSGQGIDEKDLNNIFEIFYRGTNSRREEGLGIGLAVVKNIIDMHGWNIKVTSELGVGSCFTIIIPLCCSKTDLNK